MSIQPECIVINFEHKTLSASERSHLRWGLGTMTVSLIEFAERVRDYPDRDDNMPDYHDKSGTIILGYN